jgi:hypothetical protein
MSVSQSNSAFAPADGDEYQVCMYVCMHACMYVCMYVYVYM